MCAVLSTSTYELIVITHRQSRLLFLSAHSDDKVEEGFLSNALDLTCRAWQQRFGVSYMHCGCPLPGDTIGQKLSRLTSRFASSSSSSEPASLGNPLEPLDQPDALAATHPSSHNCVSVPKKSEKVREQRLKKIGQRRERDLKLVKEGKMTKEALDRSLAHDAYLYPVPFYYPPVVSCGAFPAFMDFGDFQSGCAVASGPLYPLIVLLLIHTYRVLVNVMLIVQWGVQAVQAGVAVEQGVAAGGAEVACNAGAFLIV